MVRCRTCCTSRAGRASASSGKVSIFGMRHTSCSLLHPPSARASARLLGLKCTWWVTWRVTCCAAGGESLEEAWGRTVELVVGLLGRYLREAVDEPPEDLTAATTFMDAGLDSLDLLKAGPACAAELCLLQRPCRRTSEPIAEFIPDYLCFFASVAP